MILVDAQWAPLLSLCVALLRSAVEVSPLFVAVVSAAAVAAAHAAVAAEVAAAVAAFDFHVAAVKVWRCLAMHFIKNFFISYFSSSLLFSSLLFRFFFIYKIFSFMLCVCLLQTLHIL